MIYVYLGEFITPKKRDSYLLCLEIFWILGMIAGPGQYTLKTSYLYYLHVINYLLLYY